MAASRQRWHGGGRVLHPKLFEDKVGKAHRPVHSGPNLGLQTSILMIRGFCLRHDIIVPFVNDCGIQSDQKQHQMYHIPYWIPPVGERVNSLGHSVNDCISAEWEDTSLLGCFRCSPWRIRRSLAATSMCDDRSRQRGL